MIRNYLRFVFRNFKRNPGFLSINIIGLAVGIATVLLITLYINHELSFDNYHEKKDRIYRIVSFGGFAEKNWGDYVAGNPIQSMRESYTEIEDATKYMNCGTNYLRIEDVRYDDISMLCTESNIFNIFSFNLIAGNPNEALNTPNRVVISRSLADRIYNGENPIGKIIPINLFREEAEFEVAGLMEDIPVNSHFSADIFVSYVSLENTNLCLDCGQRMYALLNEGNEAGIDSVESRILSHIRDINGRTYVDDIKLEPLSDVYFSKTIEQSQGNMQYIYIMSGIAFLVLLIGCANYMNLATARFSQRSKEIGVRKVLGADRKELMTQFFLETILLTLLALPVAMILLGFTLPYFNELAGTEISIDWLQNITLYATILASIIVIALVAGSYPALFLSSFKPSDVIKGELKPSFSSTSVRKILVVFQFFVAIVMIIITSVIMNQLFYVQEKNLGFDSDQVVIARLTDQELMVKHITVREEFEKLAYVKEASSSSGVPIQRGGSHIIHELEDGTNIRFVMPTVDENFLSTMDIKLVSGRNISTELKEGVREVLINLDGVKRLGLEFPEDALELEISGYTVVGVIEDFHIKPLDVEMQPILLSQNQWGRGYGMLVKLQGGNIANALDGLKEVWNDMGALEPLDIKFLDDQINELYQKERNTAKTIGSFAFLAIFLCCLGLFGLVTFITEQRIKEIGIRKVLGATVSNIILLLFKDFGKLILISFFISIPIAFYTSEKWLENFVYRIEIGPVIFLVSGLIVMIIALISTGIRSRQAALTNPAEILRG